MTFEPKLPRTDATDAIFNLFKVQRHLVSRSTLRTFWANAMPGLIAASAASA